MIFLSCVKPGKTDEAVLTVHYFRYGGDYAGWNIWAWPVEPPGNGERFLFDLDNPYENGFVTAKIYFPEEVKEVGVIVRRSEDGNDWVEKDTNNDRFTTANEIWLKQGDPVVYTEKPERTGPPVLFAAADGPDTIVFTLVREPEDYGVFAVYDGERKLAGVSQKAEQDGLFRGVITLEEKISDPSKLFTVRDETGGFLSHNVIMRNILNDFYYDGDDLGLSFNAAQSGFKVWAPTATAVSVALYDGPGEYNSAGRVTNHENGTLHPMEKDAKTGVWSAVIPGDLEGKFYLYRVTFADGNQTCAADPYAKAVSANGQRMAIIDFSKTNPAGWRSIDKPVFGSQSRFGAPQDAVIYELHVRDFSIDENSGMKHRGKYLAFTERGTVNSDGVPTGVDHLVRLGITHVHLLPVYDFASLNELTVHDRNSTEPKFNWGYDPMHYNVPEGSYSTNPKNPSTRITEFKQMVQALHNAGIRVIMDVVYNHTFQTGGWPFDALVPGYYYRMTDTGLYANGSGCGNEVASERPMVRKFIIDSCRYWMNEYNIDGFRFDLMGLIDTPTMVLLTEELRRIDPSIIIYGEPWQAGGSILPEELQTVIGSQKGLGFAIFNDRIRTAVKGGSDDSTKGFASSETGTEAGIVRGIMGSVHDFTNEANESINYVTAHDNLNLWDKFALSFGAEDMANNPYSLLHGKQDIFDSNVVKSVLLSNGIVFTSQGIPFFQAGDEFLRTKFGDHNSYQSPDSVNKIRWENATLYSDVIDYYAGLISLRREYPAFRQTLKEDIENSIEIITAENMGVSFIIKDISSAAAVFVAYNGGFESKTFALPPVPQVWFQVVNARRAGTQTLAEVSGSVTLPPLSMAVLVKNSP